MKPRKSLNQKIQFLNEIGSLKTYSYQEALEIQQHEERATIKALYMQGKVLCRFEFYPESKFLSDEIGFEMITQFNTLPNFVKNLIYPWIP